MLMSESLKTAPDRLEDSCITLKLKDALLIRFWFTNRLASPEFH
jgi:hypothetical protein